MAMERRSCGVLRLATTTRCGGGRRWLGGGIWAAYNGVRTGSGVFGGAAALGRLFPAPLASMATFFTGLAANGSRGSIWDGVSLVSITQSGGLGDGVVLSRGGFEHATLGVGFAGAIGLVDWKVDAGLLRRRLHAVALWGDGFFLGNGQLHLLSIHNYSLRQLAKLSYIM